MELDHDFDIFAFKDDSRQSPSQPGMPLFHYFTIKYSSHLDFMFTFLHSETVQIIKKFLNLHLNLCIFQVQ